LTHLKHVSASSCTSFTAKPPTTGFVPEEGKGGTSNPNGCVTRLLPVSASFANNPKVRPLSDSPILR